MLAQATAAKRRARAEPIGLIRTPNTSCGLGGCWDINEPRKEFGVPISKRPPLRDATRPATASPQGKASCAGSRDGAIRHAIAPCASRQEINLERHRTGGMTVIAVLNIVVGGIEILAGLFPLRGAYEWGVDLFVIPAALVAFALLVLAAGVVGIIAGIGMLRLRSWARRLSLAFSGLLILSAGGLLMLISIFTPFIMPIIASIGSYDPISDPAAMIPFTVTYLVLPVSYSFVLFVVFNRPAWRATFAKG